MTAWHKYGAKKVEHAGRSFASKLEAAVFDMLCLREKAGEIRLIGQQDTVYLSDAEIVYKPDFNFLDVKTDRVCFAEAKGVDTPVWRIKRRLWIAYGPAPLEIWKGSWQRPVLDEVVIPRRAA